MKHRKRIQQHPVIIEFAKMIKMRQIITVEDYFKYRHAHIRDLSLEERRLLMTWINRSTVSLKVQRHQAAVHSEIEMR